MKIVVVETSTGQGEVALADESGVIATAAMTMARKHARDLAPTIKELLDTRGWRPQEIDLMITDLGPGSYTGLRVGITTVKTLAYATGAAVIGLDVMNILAQQAPAAESRISLMVDAQQGNVYSASFEKTSGELRQTELTTIEPAQTWADRLVSGTYVSGPALDRYSGLVPVTCKTAIGASRYPMAVTLWRMGLLEYRVGRRDDFWTLEPLYLRASSAEIKWDSRKNERSQADGAPPPKVDTSC